MVKKDIDDINDKRENLKSEISLLELEQTELTAELKMKEQRERDRIEPEIERVRKAIA